jgi:phage protein D
MGFSDLAGVVPAGGAGGAEFTYKVLYAKYATFDIATVKVELNGKVFADKHPDIFINDVRVDLSCGFEASMASFRLYNAYFIDQTGDPPDSKFLFDKINNEVILGAPVKIFFGYSGKYAHVFTGFVASVDFCYDGIDLHYIEVTAMDAKGVMMASSYAAQLTAKSYGDAVKEVLKRVSYNNMQEAEIISKVSVADTPDKQQGEGGGNKASAETIEMVSESDYEFIVKAAKKYNYEFFIDRGEVVFRKARSNVKSLIELKPSFGIMTFRLSYSLTGMVENIEVRSLDAGTGKLVSAKTKYSGKMSTKSKAKSLVKKSKRVYIDPTIYTQQQADARLESLLTQMSYRLGTVECECIGMPELVPGRFAKISVGSPGDNNFYITNVVHEITQTGQYITRLTGCTDTLEKTLAPSVPGGL